MKNYDEIKREITLLNHETIALKTVLEFSYSKVSNKRTGTFINSRPKFPVVRKLFPPNMTLTPLN